MTAGPWDAAGAYDRYIGRYGPSLADALIAFAGVEPGMRALDVGCGPGALTAALAGRLGRGACHGRRPVRAVRGGLPRPRAGRRGGRRRAPRRCPSPTARSTPRSPSWS